MVSVDFIFGIWLRLSGSIFCFQASNTLSVAQISGRISKIRSGVINEANPAFPLGPFTRNPENE